MECTYKDDDDTCMKSATSIRAHSRKNRVYMFREFVWLTYSGYLAAGDVVLDVAGGKGDLSWLLLNLDGLQSVVLDPRRTKNDHMVRSVQYLRNNPEEAQRRSKPNNPTFQPLAAMIPILEQNDYILQEPRHLRIYVDDDLVRSIRSVQEGGADRMEKWEKYWMVALQRGRNNWGNESFGNENEIVDPGEALSVILRARLVLGFHPDQATDASLDLAAALRIPFCVVPCCVFPSDFPLRALPDGSRVRSYDDLIGYLLHKHSGSPHQVLQQSTLSFQGTSTARNKVLFTLPCCSE